METKNRPNILWYCTDQQRSDTIHALGCDVISTPNIDRLVDSGVAFNRCYTQSPICTPSRATFLTGRYPSTHHVHRNGADWFPSSEVLVTRILADSGYDCGLIGKLHLSRAKKRIEHRPNDGYGTFLWSHHPHPDWPEGHAYADWLANLGVDPAELYASQRGLAYGEGVPEEYHQTTWCTEMALEFIRRNRSEPWVLSINPFDPHPPFNPPADYLRRYDPEKMELPLFRESDIEHQKRFSAVDQQTREAVDPGLLSQVGSPRVDGDSASEPPDSYDPRTVRACYYAMIELIDHQFGRILEALGATGQLENTLIIFTSDHGELLGDHGLLLKGCRFYEGLVHVPLIMAWGDELMRGARRDALVELVDLAPTVVDAAGIDIPSAMQGQSLLPLLRGDTEVGKPFITSEFYDAIDVSSASQSASQSASHASMYFDGRYKCVVYHTEETGEIYDLEKDPGEFDDLWDDPKSAGLKSRLIESHFNAIMSRSGAGIERTDSY